MGWEREESKWLRITSERTDWRNWGIKKWGGDVEQMEVDVVFEGADILGYTVLRQ